MNSYICTIADLAYYENEKNTTVNVDIQDEKIEMNCEVDGICFSASGKYYFETFQQQRDSFRTSIRYYRVKRSDYMVLS